MPAHHPRPTYRNMRSGRYTNHRNHYWHIAMNTLGVALLLAIGAPTTRNLVYKAFDYQDPISPLSNKIFVSVRAAEAHTTPTPNASPSLGQEDEVDDKKRLRREAVGSIEEKIVAGWQRYANRYHKRTIRAQHKDVIDAQVRITQEHEFWGRNPFLMPAIMIAESSGCENMTYPRPNPINCINWGIRIDEWNRKTESMTTPQIIEHAASRIQQSDLYATVRDAKTHEEAICTFARIYEPMNDDYCRQLLATIAAFEN